MKGFTLIELVFSILLLSLLGFFLPSIYSQIKFYQSSKNKLQIIENKEITRALLQAQQLAGNSLDDLCSITYKDQNYQFLSCIIEDEKVVLWKKIIPTLLP